MKEPQTPEKRIAIARYQLSVISYLWLVLLFFPVALSAQLRPAGIFSDHMILQRDTEITVWGKASKGSRVKVNIASRTATAKTDDQEHWTVNLPALPAGGPYRLVIESGKERMIYEDVLIGDVWFASGQSNMEHPVRGWEWLPESSVYHLEKELMDADFPMIRLCSIPKCPSPVPLSDVYDCRWKVANSSSVAEFCAPGWFFAKYLHQEMGVPIGIIHSSWGGTAIRPWMSKESLEDLSLYQPVKTPENFNERDWVHQMQEINRQTQQRRCDISGSMQGREQSTDPYTDADGSWTDTDLTLRGHNFSNVVWLRKQIDIPECFSKEQLDISLGYPERQAHVYFNGVGMGYFGYPAPVRFLVPRSLLVPGKNLLTIRLAQPFGSPKVRGDSTHIFLRNLSNTWALPITDGWKANDNLETITPAVDNYQGHASYLYNGMVAPITRFKIKGFLWSQGEADAGHPELYTELFKKLIVDWREKWMQGDLPFLFVQATSYMPEPGKETFTRVKLREAQAAALELPHTGMVVSIDIGDPYDVHPKNKKEVGRRLALQALQLAYGRQTVADGPVYVSHRVENGRIHIRFHTFGKGLQLQNIPAREVFVLTDRNGKPCSYHMEIIRDEIVIYPESGRQISEIRYAWNDDPVCSLFNSDGLPAAPFCILTGRSGSGN